MNYAQWEFVGREDHTGEVETQVHEYLERCVALLFVLLIVIVVVVVLIVVGVILIVVVVICD